MAEEFSKQAASDAEQDRFQEDDGEDGASLGTQGAHDSDFTPPIGHRIVDADEARALNHEYRGKDYATNVLTFPLTEEPHLMGDIICAEVIAQEALMQNKPLIAHYAHLTVHGILHLHGYDHETEAQAGLMEAIETQIVTKLGYANPYLITEDAN